MHELIYVKRSRIHGRGVFARKRIARDRYIEAFRGRTTRRNGPYVFWVLQDDGSQRGVDGRNELRFLNHASRPNAEFHGDELYSIRVIQAHQEITIDYGEGWDDET